MTLLVLLILAALWAVVLVPPLLRARGARSVDSVGAFRHRLGVLGRTHSGPSALAVSASHPSVRPYRTYAPSGARRVSPAVAKRRRDVLSTLGCATLVSLAGAALAHQTIFWGLFVVCLGLLSAYVVMLARMQRLADERAVKVRYLPRERYRAQPAMIYRRTVSS